MKVVNLTVHKNTLAKRRIKEGRKNAVQDMKRLVNNKDIAGYAIATWNKDGDVRAFHHHISDSLITSHTLPETLKMSFTYRYVTLGD